MCQNRIHSKKGSDNALISTRTFWVKKKEETIEKGKKERGLLTSFRRPLLISFASIIHLHISHNTPCLPPKVCITLAFNFSWVLQSFQKKLETIFMQNILRGKTRCTCCTFYRPKANLFYSKWRNLRVWRHFRVILFNQTELNVGDKTHDIAFQLLLRQCFEISCTFLLLVLS